MMKKNISMFDKLCEIINPNERYFVKGSRTYEKCQLEFDNDLSNGNVNKYIKYLQAELERVSEPSAYKYKIECLILEFKRIAWDIQVHTLTLSNKEIMMLKRVLEASANLAEEKHEKISMEFLVRNYDAIKELRKRFE